MNRTPRARRSLSGRHGGGLVGGHGSAATAAAASNGVCPPVTSVKWVAPYAPAPRSGTTYTVQVKGKMTCAEAVGYVKSWSPATFVRINRSRAARRLDLQGPSEQVRPRIRRHL